MLDASSGLLPKTLTTNEVCILSWDTPSASEKNARKIAEFMGAQVTFVPAARPSKEGTIGQGVAQCAALVVHAETLARVAETLGADAGSFGALLEMAANVFIYGFDSTEKQAALLKSISSGGLLGCTTLPAGKNAFHVSAGCREWCHQFSGLSVQTANPERGACFIEGELRDRHGVLVRVGQSPFLVCIGRDGKKLFLSASPEFADLDEKASSKAGLLPWFSRLVPLMMFLRMALGRYAWHSPRSQACFIVDDPLLKPRYGFLTYSKLMELMAAERFSAAIAFIPWNYRRSRKRIAQLFSAPGSSLSVCVHGCDHTGGEFSSSATDVLRDKACLALERMQAHQKLAGVPFDDVMVFPQGLFSSAAMKALDAGGYLAAVNTSADPLNMPQSVTLRDLIDVAVTRFEGFPLFGRSYPNDVAEFAFDLFLGKPALIVEHHDYFRKGYEPLRAFIRKLNVVDENLEWRNLGSICSEACTERLTAGGHIEVRFYTDRFRFTNRGGEPRTYSFSRKWASERRFAGVQVNGQSCAAVREGERLTITRSVEPGETIELRILGESLVDAPTPAWKPTVAHNARVLVRRLLCEFRDDHIATSEFLSGLVSKVRKLRPRRARAETRLSPHAN